MGVKLETEPVKLGSGPIKLSVTKLMCDESETKESLSDSGVKNILKIDDIDCDAKSKNEKMPLLLNKPEFSGEPKKLSLNEDIKVKEKIVSNLVNIDNERKMDYAISSDQVKPARRGRSKISRSQDGTDKLEGPTEEATKEENIEKMEIKQI